ncbi:MAG: carbamoyltransferase [Hyphomicrobiaceae bacterium]
MRILGISAFYHDAAACLIADGEIVAAAQEERFTRRKHDPDFPRSAISYCLDAAGCRPADVDYVVFYEKPLPKFERLLETYLAFAPRGLASFSLSLPVWVKDKLFLRRMIELALRDLWGNGIDLDQRLLFSEHHLSHAASAFFPSPFEEAAVLTMDGVGEWTTTSLAIGRGNTLSVEHEIQFPHSIGLLYSAFTYYTGFKVNSGEYKVMGLAPYGEPRFADLIRKHLVDIKEDGSFRLDMRYFNYCTGLTMTSKKFHDLFGAPPRKPETLLTQREMDLAASIQAVTEEIILKLARAIRTTTGQRNLCLAGGVALNCVANGKLAREHLFERIWVQPAAGDAGGALGAALAVHYGMLGHPRSVGRGDTMRGSYLGPEYASDDIASRLTAAGAVFDVLTDEGVIARTAASLAEGNAVGWHQGRMEFGPRALGARSILADPRSPSMQKVLNLKVKFRESFRPFAPSVLAEDARDWFELDDESPYMLMVADVVEKRRKPMSGQAASLFGIDKLNVARSEIPAVTHVDYSARVQTVTRDVNPRYYDLLRSFKMLTGCPLLVNTSFNIRGEPIVNTPEDAYRCFLGTGLDVLVVGNAYLEKAAQPAHLLAEYKDAYELD